MPTKKIDTRIKLLLELLDRSYDRVAWHGSIAKSSIRGLKPNQSLWRPGPKRHNIWEIVLHMAYWKYAVRRRLTQGPKSSFPRKGSDWIKLPPQPDAKAWKRDVALLHEQHKLLREAIKNFPPSQLDKIAPNSKLPNMMVIYGIAQHDVYHTGQIQLLKKLLKSK